MNRRRVPVCHECEEPEAAVFDKGHGSSHGPTVIISEEEYEFCGVYCGAEFLFRLDPDFDCPGCELWTACGSASSVQAIPTAVIIDGQERTFHRPRCAALFLWYLGERFQDDYCSGRMQLN